MKPFILHYHAVFSFVLLSTAFSCKTDITVPSVRFNPDVYLAGYEFIPNSNFAVATYWKNGVAVHLTDGSKWAEAHSIVVSGNEVHVVGREGGESGDIIYWKNGTRYQLASCCDNGFRLYGYTTTSIAVSGNDVYAAGTIPSYKYIINFDHSVAAYWKNGSQINLTADTVSSAAFAIAVSGDDIYVAGFKFGKHYEVATYWKNGVTVKLTDGLTDTLPSYATGIVVSGSDVYVTGVQGDPYSQNAYPPVKYWKNGVAMNLTGNGNYVTDIAISGNDVFVSGSSSDGYYQNAVYWKNGIPVQLSSAPQTGRVSSIAVSGDDVYAAGGLFFGVQSGRSASICWKNGSPAIVMMDTVSAARIKSVYLATKK